MEFINRIVKKLPGEEKKIIENTFIRWGFSLEVRREREVIVKDEKSERNYKIFYPQQNFDKKIEVKDFVDYFRTRYQTLQKILLERQELQNNMISIGKLSNDRTPVSIIGIVSEKRITKNNNMIIRMEDLTGEINVLVRRDHEELFNLANELQLDDVIGIKGSGNRDLIFVHDIFFPDVYKFDKVRFERDINIIFISDIHAGSDRHLEKSFRKFLNWIKSEDEEAKKVDYIFFVGDNVDGVGIFPGQEDVLKLKNMEEQYDLLTSYLREIPERITMFMCPGQHDATRVAEPQPLIDKRYAKKLYEIENLILVSNPCMIKLLEKDKEFKILMYHGASIHSFINGIPELRKSKAHQCPAKAVKHMLKRRHLAPTHGNVVYIPNPENDPLAISEVPDILCTGEVHRLDVENYKGVMIITGSCWQAQTPFEEKVGNIPDPCKVPILNLKTRQLKIYDFSDEGEINEWN